MSRHGISEADVLEACENLISKNINVTIENIRKILGTGSNSTIAKHLKKFKKTGYHGLMNNLNIADSIDDEIEINKKIFILNKLSACLNILKFNLDLESYITQASNIISLIDKLGQLFKTEIDKEK